MIFLSAQPYDLYFLWQCEVQIVNFRKFGISDKMHILVWYPEQAEMNEIDKKTKKLVRKYVTSPDLTGWDTLSKKYPEVKIFLYKDEGVNLGLYIPQLRPHVLKKHFWEHPELKNETIFYHDSDIIFNYLPDFQRLAEGDVNWESDCSHYLDYRYLYKKEIQGNIPRRSAITKLCNIGNITPQIMCSYKNNTGGAQCILKGIDGDFWEDVERQCLEIRKAFTHVKASNIARTPENTSILKDSINTTYFLTEDAGFQSWCADMWAVNMALWSRGKKTQVTPELDFSWATDNLETFKRKPVMHNAGATRLTPKLFYKADWRDKSPIGQNIEMPPIDSASRKYVEAIKEVK